jgi:hypothetical protein
VMPRHPAAPEGCGAASRIRRLGALLVSARVLSVAAPGQPVEDVHAVTDGESFEVNLGLSRERAMLHAALAFRTFPWLRYLSPLH